MPVRPSLFSGDIRALRAGWSLLKTASFVGDVSIIFHRSFFMVLTASLVRLRSLIYFSFSSGAPISRSNFPLSRRVSSFSWLHLPRSSFFSGSKIRKEERVSLLSLQLQSEVQYTRCGFSISLSPSLVIASSSLLSMRMHKKKKRGSSLLSSSS